MTNVAVAEGQRLTVDADLHGSEERTSNSDAVHSFQLGKCRARPAASRAASFGLRSGVDAYKRDPEYAAVDALAGASAAQVGKVIRIVRHRAAAGRWSPLRPTAV
jgi:hypothetical protein